MPKYRVPVLVTHRAIHVVYVEVPGEEPNAERAKELAVRAYVHSSDNVPVLDMGMKVELLADMRGFDTNPKLIE